MHNNKFIWKSKTTDFSVTVIKSLGIGTDGREYLQIAESQSAVPKDELITDPTLNSKKPPLRRLF